MHAVPLHRNAYHCRYIHDRGRWENRTSTLPGGWKFFSDEDSCRQTESRWGPDGLQLEGEPAGRQSWDKIGDGDVASPDLTVEGEGKFPSFNASVNPNSGDKVLRAQMVRLSRTQLIRYIEFLAVYAYLFMAVACRPLVRRTTMLTGPGKVDDLM